MTDKRLVCCCAVLCQHPDDSACRDYLADLVEGFAPGAAAAIRDGMGWPTLLGRQFGWTYLDDDAPGGVRQEVLCELPTGVSPVCEECRQTGQSYLEAGVSYWFCGSCLWAAAS